MMPANDDDAQKVGEEKPKIAPSGIVGFHLTPPLWIGDEPPESNAEVSLQDLQTEAYRRSLSVGIRVKVLHSGVFVFDFSDWPVNRPYPVRPQTWEEYDDAGEVIAARVQIMNAYLACLYSALQIVQQVDQEKMVISAVDLVPYSQFESAPKGIDDLFVLSLTRSTQAGVFKLEISSKFRHTFNQHVSVTTLDKSFDMLEDLLARNSNSPLLLAEMLLRSRKAFEDIDHNLSLIIAWSMTELMITNLWDRYIEDNRKRTIDGQELAFINKERKERLNDARSYTASVIAEVLSLANILPFDLYSRTIEVRQSRNAWVHSLKPVTRAQAEKAVVLASDTLKFVEGIDLPARRRIRIFLG